MTKEYLKMADGFKSGSKWFGDALREETGAADELINSAVHAIDSHDELVAEVERLRDALTSSRLSLSNAAMNMKWFDISKAQEILREVNAIDKLISAIGTSDAKI